MTRESTRGPQYSNEVERRDRVLERRFKVGSITPAHLLVTRC